MMGDLGTHRIVALLFPSPFKTNHRSAQTAVGACSKQCHPAGARRGSPSRGLASIQEMENQSQDTTPRSLLTEVDTAIRDAVSVTSILEPDVVSVLVRHDYHALISAVHCPAMGTLAGFGKTMPNAGKKITKFYRIDAQIATNQGYRHSSLNGHIAGRDQHWVGPFFVGN